ncbi:predicted protein [Naegleria gruberi]|uniref:Predicted protein n=1 Tax=Naegleria gruberi TaxID=5762 RepID=D2W149_NAEGR|nr:uncharacterized protein NAEGRDRAFT_75088 [Naegleria gruberi]EFC37119.1 predicted protein [Naegleria gruberi]|eukprot:XP_002669863.1 predicted protein [Naegleria gruberi strain NEG-M]
MFDSVDITKTSKEEFQTIMTTLRNHLKTINPEQYSIALLQKDEIQVNILTILFCLNAELATIKDFTKTPSTGLLRLSWWKDQVKNALVGLPPRVPVLMALSFMQVNYFNKGFTCLNDNYQQEQEQSNINTSTTSNTTGSTSTTSTQNNNSLKFSHLRNIFKWREVDLKWKQPATLADIESYSEGVYSTLIMSHLQCSKYRDVHTDHVASHLGRSYGICTLLRSVPHLSEHQSTYLPAQLCAKYGITEDDIYKHQNSHELEEVVFKVADLAKSHLDLARELADLKDEKTNKLLVNPKAYPLFMTSIVCEVFLEKLEKVNFNIFHPSIGAQQLRFQFYLDLEKQVGSESIKLFST